MSKEIKLSAEKRDKKEKVAALRRSGLVPACMYGPGSGNSDLKVKRSEFLKVFSAAGESHLIDLTIDSSAPLKVLVKDVQKTALSESIIHIDFYQVDMNKKITAEIPLNFIGESKAVKESGAILVKDIEAVKVKCLAKDLADNITVDISVLANLHDAIRMHDLKLPEGMELVSQTDEIVATVIEQKVEVEAPAPVAEGAPAEGEKSAQGGSAAGGKDAGKGEGAKAEAKK